MEFRFSHSQIAEIRDAVAALHELQECLIEDISWAERGLELIVKLAYIWTDAGEISFAAGVAPRKLTLRFHLVNKVHMFNALSEAMLQEPERMNWGISEIAKFAVNAARDSHEFAEAEFIWEWDRRILVWFRAITIELADPANHS